MFYFVLVQHIPKGILHHNTYSTNQSFITNHCLHLKNCVIYGELCWKDLLYFFLRKLCMNLEYLQINLNHFYLKIIINEIFIQAKLNAQCFYSILLLPLPLPCITVKTVAAFYVFKVLITWPFKEHNYFDLLKLLIKY